VVSKLFTLEGLLIFRSWRHVVMRQDTNVLKDASGCYFTTKLYGVTTHKTTNWFYIAVRTSNLFSLVCFHFHLWFQRFNGYLF